MKPFVNCMFVLSLLAGFFVGTSANYLLAQAGSAQQKNCGGAPPAGSTDRTNNKNCKRCVSGCQLKDDKFKVCQDTGTGCVIAPLPDLKKCDGDLWSKKDCTGSTVGTCQDNYRYCTN